VKRGRGNRGIILAVVLVMIALLSLVMASFLYFVRAEAAGIAAHVDRQQGRLAAESGLEEVIAFLRQDKHNVALWFDVPERFRHGLVWGEGFDHESDPVREFGSRQEYFEREGARVPAWRFSVTARRYGGPEGSMRFGITPESAKLNLNVASEEQIAELLTPLLLDLGIEAPQEYINALLDWRDADSDVRDNGAEDEYYNNLEPGPPYNAKNGRFDTVEELLLVKGFTAAILYGEDVNRNGILDENEDDGDASLPDYDNADGILNPGIAPFLTVHSRELDTATDNRPRINLNTDAAVVGAQIADYFEEGEVSETTIQFLLGLKQQNFNFASIGSPADLYAGPGVEGAASQAGEEEPNDGGVNEALTDSPVTLDELPVLMDYFSVRPTQLANVPIEGLIHVNTAPARVLRLVPNMTEAMVESIVATRPSVEEDALRTTAWLVTSGAVTPAQFRRVAPYLTARSFQFEVEVLGYADHVKTFRRLEWIVEMIGPVAQIKYYRDLTRLGFAWPIDDESVLVQGT
jgi:type II secretory pathway component PulK